MDPCEQALDKDLDGDGLPELAVSCPFATGERSYTIYRQAPAGCFTRLVELTGAGWDVVAGGARTAGFPKLTVWQPPSRNDGDLVDEEYVYDPPSRAYRGGARSRTDGPNAKQVQLSKAVGRISGILGISVGEPGVTGVPACCLDCESLVPEFQKLAALATRFAAPIGAAELRAAGSAVRATRWTELFESTAYSAKTRKRFVKAVTEVADQLDAVATSLAAGDDASRLADKLAGAVTRLIAAAGQLGNESTSYCGSD